MWAFGGLVYILGGLLYVFRFPEKYFPFKFDILGSSHNLLHVAVLLGCGIHLNEAMTMFIKRQQFVCPIAPAFQ